MAVTGELGEHVGALCVEEGEHLREHRIRRDLCLRGLRRSVDRVIHRSNDRLSAKLSTDGRCGSTVAGSLRPSSALIATASCPTSRAPCAPTVAAGWCRSLRRARLGC